MPTNFVILMHSRNTPDYLPEGGVFGWSLSESKEESRTLKLPQRISVELKPRTRAAWARVQALAQNPRIVLSLVADKRLSYIIDFLNKKWKTERLQFTVSFVM